MTLYAGTAMAIVVSMAAVAAAPAPWAASAPQTTVPFTIVASGGADRIVVDVAFNGHRFPMMAHANAEFVSQLRHEQAAEFGIQTGAKTSNYGIEAHGHASSRGRSETTAAAVTIGGTTYRNVPVSVFQVPQHDIGMLGLGWISAARAVFDLPGKRIVLNPTPRHLAQMRTRLLASGYLAVPMRLDPRSGRFDVEASLNGVAKRMVVNSSGGTRLDSAFAQAAGVEAGAVTGEGGGPSGNTVEIRTAAKPVELSVGRGGSAEVTPIIFDEYKYLGSTRPSDPATITGGELGLSFLIAKAAVVDFGSRVLYVKAKPAV